MSTQVQPTPQRDASAPPEDPPVTSRIDDTPTSSDRVNGHPSPSDPAGQADEAKGPVEEASKKKKEGRIPDWVTKALKDKRKLKTLARCWLASWVTFLLLLPSKSLQTLGQAAFFTCMITLMIPSGMAVMVWLFANFTLVLGCVIGWAWSCAGMAAALRSRDRVLLQSQLRIAQSSIAGATNPESQYSALIFRGNFLDTRSTAVFGVFFVIGTYFAGVVTAKMPKLKLMAVFMTILLDVMCSYGPLFPIQQYTLGEIFLLPIGVSLGISFACLILIFPETLQHAWQSQLGLLLKTTSSLLKSHAEFLEAAKSGDVSSLESFEKGFEGSKAAIIAMVDGLEAQTGFLEMEVVRGRTSAKDLIKVFRTVRTMSVRLFGLSAFHHLVDGMGHGDPVTDEKYAAKSMDEDRFDLKKPVLVHDTHTLLRARKRYRDAELSNHVELTTLLPVLASAAQPALAASGELLTQITQWVDKANSTRWKKSPSSEEHSKAVEEIGAAVEKLRITIRDFVQRERRELIKPYEKHFTASSVSGDGPLQLSDFGAAAFRSGARPLFYCLTWCANFANFAEALLALGDELHLLASKRGNNRIWWPTGLRKLGKLVTNRRSSSGQMDFGGQATGEEVAQRGLDQSSASSTADTASLSDDEENVNDPAGDDVEKGIESKAPAPPETKPKLRPRIMDPDAMPAEHFGHHLGRSIAGIYDFVWSPVGVFALKYSIVSFALWIPAVLPSSANFVYQNRGLWALIMAQTGMALTAGEQIFSLAGRLIGTLAGLVLGMLIWYISTGNGNGNRYGLAATMAVALLPMVFLRLYAPPILLMPVMMLGVTTILITGYSWIDSHLTVTANSGIGVDVAWRRALLVIIGMAASVIVMIFPRPISSRSVVRHQLAHGLADILSLYTSITEAWIIVEGSDAEEAREREKQRSDKVLASFRTRYIAAQTKLGAVRMSIGMASLDMQARGRWPKERYVQLFAAEQRCLEALSQLYSALNGMDVVWRRRFAATTAILNPGNIADICATLSLIRQSLDSGLPLPHAGVGVLLERMIQHQAVAVRLNDRINAMQGAAHEQGGGVLTLDVLQNPQYMRHVAGVMALAQFVTKVDECSAIVKSLVGELDLPGFDALKDSWEDRLVTSFGFA